MDGHTNSNKCYKERRSRRLGSERKEKGRPLVHNGKQLVMINYIIGCMDIHIQTNATKREGQDALAMKEKRRTTTGTQREVPGHD